MELNTWCYCRRPSQLVLAPNYGGVKDDGAAVKAAQDAARAHACARRAGDEEDMEAVSGLTLHLIFVMVEWSDSQQHTCSVESSGFASPKGSTGHYIGCNCSVESE